MRFLLSILLTAVLAFVAGMYLEWWSIAIVAFLVALLLPQGLGRSFLAGFLGIFLLWGVLSLWIDIKNDSLLSNKMAGLFGLPSGILLVLITALVGALVGGFAAMSGSSLRGRRGMR
jgi:hypothetical protein